MTRTMAEVLAEHWSRSTHTDRKPFVDKCDGCGAVIFSWGDCVDADEALAAHQAAALSAAGFGLVADAGAKADPLKRVRGELKSIGKFLRRWIKELDATTKGSADAHG